MKISQLRCQNRVVKNDNHDEMKWNEMKWNEMKWNLWWRKTNETFWSFKLRTNNECLKVLFAIWISYAQKNRKKKTHDHLIVDYFLSHDHVQTQNFCVLYAFRTNVQNSLFLIFYLMMTFKRRISVFCMFFVRMLKILYVWFFISWWRLNAEFLCFVCLSYECWKFFIFDSLFHDDV
jgi:hypothetical protein